MQIKDCPVIVTGGASGMGAATAMLLSQQGAKVALLDLNLELAEELASESKALAVQCDVTKESSVVAAIKKVESHYGVARICINCAGIVHSRRMVNREGRMSLEEFNHVINVNLSGTFNVMRLIAERLMSLTNIQEEERGVIINTASIAAFDGQIGQIAYSASKGAIVGITLPAARELAQFGIRVMCIAPGLVDTPLFAKLTPEARTSLAGAVPFPKRLAHPREYAQLVLSIIQNPMLNGEVIRLDGALRMQPK